MVYIHGESYDWNSGNPYDGSVMASVGNVIVITINFRLEYLITNSLTSSIIRWISCWIPELKILVPNPAGEPCPKFLPAVEGSSRGNYGIMDQVAALHWIQENIAQFGGDPKNVTILAMDMGHHVSIC
ncbi:neuroligin-4, X-linked [Caerostris extrusa]|uniref:Neuroligin-4, X-linked n=1 Tax=Caerostris extrusa TaxID=172846 RepID=A0AAV4U3K3_CAEEX|nr:neuroligin-4, X-linked [Caerostris extrusa]